MKEEKALIQVQFVESVNPIFVTEKANKILKELQEKDYEIINAQPFFSATYTEDKKSAKRLGCMITYAIPPTVNQ